jgi:hypothetical protein
VCRLFPNAVLVSSHFTHFFLQSVTFALSDDAPGGARPVSVSPSRGAKPAHGILRHRSVSPQVRVCVVSSELSVQVLPPLRETLTHAHSCCPIHALVAAAHKKP